MDPSIPAQKALLVLAHPGHELRVHHWVERARPVVAVLTDGSGGAAAPRAESSRRLLEAAGAKVSGLFALGSDKAFYGAVMAQDAAMFLGIVQGLSGLLAAEGCTLVVSDAAEGYNPIHDLCHALAALVAEQARVPHLDFPLVGPPETSGPFLRLDLDAPAFERKLAAARGYRELAGELETAAATFGLEAFKVECLRVAVPPDPDGKPYYETYGERMVAEGRYGETLRRSSHLEPLLGRVREAIRASASLG